MKQEHKKEGNAPPPVGKKLKAGNGKIAADSPGSKQKPAYDEVSHDIIC